MQDELEDLAALRSAVLASMKMKSKEEEGKGSGNEEDPELAALRAAALQTKKATVGKLLSSEKRKPAHHPQKRENKFNQNKRQSNLIVIQTAPSEEENKLNVKNPGKREAENAAPVMLRPQDKWLGGLLENTTTTASPQREKPKDKFSRFESSDSEEEDVGSSSSSEEEQERKEDDSRSSSDSDSENDSVKSGSQQSSSDVSHSDSEDEDVVMETVDEVGGSDKSGDEGENNAGSVSESVKEGDCRATSTSKRDRSEKQQEVTLTDNGHKNEYRANAEHSDRRLRTSQASSKSSTHGVSESRQLHRHDRHDNRSHRPLSPSRNGKVVNSLEYKRPMRGHSENGSEVKVQYQARSRTHSREPMRHEFDRPHDKQHTRRDRISPKRGSKTEESKGQTLRRDKFNVFDRVGDRERGNRSNRSTQSTSQKVPTRDVQGKLDLKRERRPKIPDKSRPDNRVKSGSSSCKENESKRPEMEDTKNDKEKQEDRSDQDSDSESSTSSTASSSGADIAEDSESEDDAQPWRFTHTGQGKKLHDTKHLFERNITDIERERRLKKHAESSKIHTSLEPNQDRFDRDRRGNRLRHERPQHGRYYDRRQERVEKHLKQRGPGSHQTSKDTDLKQTDRDRVSKYDAKDVKSNIDHRDSELRKDTAHCDSQRNARNVGSRRENRDMHSKRDKSNTEAKQSARDLNIRREQVPKDDHLSRSSDHVLRGGGEKRFNADILPSRKFEDFESESESDSEKGPPLKSFLSVVKRDSNAPPETSSTGKRPPGSPLHKEEQKSKRKKRDRERHKDKVEANIPSAVQPLLSLNPLRPDGDIQICNPAEPKILDARELIRKRRGKQETVKSSPEKVPKVSSRVESKSSPVVHVTFNKEEPSSDQSLKSRVPIHQRIGSLSVKTGSRTGKTDHSQQSETGSLNLSGKSQDNRNKAPVTPLMDLEIKPSIGTVKVNNDFGDNGPTHIKVTENKEKSIEKGGEVLEPRHNVIRLSSKKGFQQRNNSEQTELKDKGDWNKSKSTIIKLNKKTADKPNVVTLSDTGEKPRSNILNLRRSSQDKDKLEQKQPKGESKSLLVIKKPSEEQEQEKPHDTRVFLQDRNVENSRLQYRDQQESGDLRTFVKQKGAGRTVSIKSRLGLSVENGDGSVGSRTSGHVGGRKIKINRKVAIESTVQRKVERSDEGTSPKFGHERDAADDLDAKIKRIQEKNAAIMKRHIEIKEDKQIFGGNVV